MRTVVQILKMISMIAGVVFLFSPMHTFTQVAVCIGSFFTSIVLGVIAANLEEESGPKVEN